MPAEMLNDERWKSLALDAASTEREHEKQRLDIILDWMWTTVLPSLQGVADANGYGSQWRAMYVKKTEAAARAATRAADAAARKLVNGAEAGMSARAAEQTEAALKTATWLLAAPEESLYFAPAVASRAARAAAWSAVAAKNTKTAWETFDPCGVLARLVEVGK